MNERRKNITIRGFTLLELIVVIAIIAVLTAMSVPYYNDYITDSRISVLKQNMANIRKVINQFRGDQGRGPFRVEVQDNSLVIHSSQISGLTSDSELFSGAIQINAKVSPLTMRRSNLKYLPSSPSLFDPVDGAKITTIDFTVASASAYFVDTDTDGIFDIDTEFAFLIGHNGDQKFTAKYDSVLYNFTGNADSVYEASPSKALDYIDFAVVSSEGTKY